MKQLMSYSLIGIVSNLIIYLLYLLITHNGVESKIAMTFLYIVSINISFFANKNFTFLYNGSLFPSFFRYLTTHFFGYLLNLLILIVCVDKLEYPDEIVQGVAIFIVAVFLFLVFNLFVFRNVSTDDGRF